MGTADFYAVVEGFDEVADSLVIDTTRARAPATRARCSASSCSPPGATLDEVEPALRKALRTELSPRHVPDRFVVVDAIPRTLNGKKCEVPVKKILAGRRPGQGRQPRCPAEPGRPDPVPRIWRAAGCPPINPAVGGCVLSSALGP